MSAVVSNEHSLAEESRTWRLLSQKPDAFVEGSHGPDTAHRVLTQHLLSRYRAQ